ncbi:MAG: hypothetical protein JXD23_06910 [Spirochaetales bacterium]|nr:hypothetical protein [Spirochaetales bacterium]
MDVSARERSGRAPQRLYGKLCTVVWDWNGTLLNDMEACIRSMNLMLENRSLPPIDFETYRNVFTFPVIDYYRAVGIDPVKNGHQNLDRFRFGPNARLVPNLPEAKKIILAPVNPRVSR